MGMQSIKFNTTTMWMWEQIINKIEYTLERAWCNQKKTSFNVVCFDIIKFKLFLCIFILLALFILYNKIYIFNIAMYNYINNYIYICNPPYS